MKIRAVKNSDFIQLKTIHECYFEKEFSFPDFLTKYLCAFVIEENDQIVAAAGVRTLAEVVMITNKEIDVRSRRQAFIDLLTASVHVAKIDGYDQLHAFVQDSKWKHHLTNNGFNPTVGEALVLEI